jgi:N-acetyl-anhydromuramyl-L-alanine amidase AmpD
METRFDGKMSTFGGPHDTGVKPDEDLALVDKDNFEAMKPYVGDYFLPTQPTSTTGTARRLNPDTYYIACRWDYNETPKLQLLKGLVKVKNPVNGKVASAKPIDWGPNVNTGRVADLSPGLASFLGLNTDDRVQVTIPTLLEDTTPALDAAPPQRILSYHYKQAKKFTIGRVNTIQSIILHSTDGREQGDIETLTGPKVSVHWYVTRTGKIYHFVDNTDTAFHAGRVSSTKYSNAASLGIEQEHFDPDPQAGHPNNENWPDAQIEASANVCAFLCQRYNLTVADIFSHAHVAAPAGRKQDPFGYPWASFKTKLATAMLSTWVAQPA